MSRPTGGDRELGRNVRRSSHLARRSPSGACWRRALYRGSLTTRQLGLLLALLLTMQAAFAARAESPPAAHTSGGATASSREVNRTRATQAARPVGRFARLSPVTIADKTYYPYSFDGHVHTHHSPDAFHPPAEVLAEAERLGLSAVIITDHGYSRAKLDVRSYKGRIVPHVGQEIGGPFGHAVFWNVELKQEVLPASTTLAERAAFAHARGGLIVLCHPGWWIGGREEDPMRWITPQALAKGGLSGNIDALELWNGVYDAPLKRLISAWEEALEAGSYVPIVGNSDFHRLGAHRIGGPRNVAYCEEPKPESCLWSAVRAGRVYVTDGPSLTLAVNGATLGDVVQLRNNDPLEVHVTGESPQGGELRVYVGREVRQRIALVAGSPFEHRLHLNAPSTSSYVRVDIARPLEDGEQMLLLSNPVRLRHQ